MNNLTNSNKITNDNNKEIISNEKLSQIAEKILTDHKYAFEVLGNAEV